jgi:multidrug efflux system membrane fusion protein
MKTATRIVAILVLLAAAAGVALVLQKQSTANNPPKPTGPRPVPITLAPVEMRDLPLRLDLVGRTEPFQTVTLRARIDGQITGVHYQAGQHIAKGQKMITLDARAIQAQVQQNEANLLRDRAQLVKAKADLQRYTDLVAKGFVSSAQLDVYRAAVDSLEGTVAADLAALELSKVQLSYTTVIAPMDGVAGAVLVFPGGSVKANDTPLVVINQVRPMYVTFSVPEARLADMPTDRGGKPLKVDVRVPGPRQQAAGQNREPGKDGGKADAAAKDAGKAGVKTADKAADKAAAGKAGDKVPNGPMTGELVFVDNTVDSTTGTIVMKARLENADERLTPGQFVEVSMVLRTLPGALVMPSEALQTGPEGTFVYVAKDDQTVEVRRVRTQPVGNRTVLVQAGLASGEKVVTDGQLQLAPGSRYEVRTPGAGPRGPGGGAAGAGGAGGQGGQAAAGGQGAGGQGTAAQGASGGGAASPGAAAAGGAAAAAGATAGEASTKGDAK